VPANCSARWVVEKERKFEHSGVHAGEARSEFADGQKKIRKLSRLPQAGAIEVVVPSKGDDPALAKETVKLELLEWQ
jgi:hypothetical protein